MSIKEEFIQNWFSPASVHLLTRPRAVLLQTATYLSYGRNSAGHKALTTTKASNTKALTTTASNTTRTSTTTLASTLDQ